MAKAKAADVPELNKREMVEEAMDSIGDPGPKEIQAYVLEKYSVDLPYSMAASYKSQINKRRGGRRGGSAGGVDVEDVVAVKALLNRLGAERLQGLIQALAQ
ncbi:MAG: hypothetical protein MUF18_08115 [Fimbriiglobus sp.]|jgi:hypothetical protein|nr:hypothetical protein [Fimbriiglobus sp.]